jgi:hypothetical protein
MKLSTIALGTILAASTFAVAQSATAQDINQRKQYQQDRIANGVRSGRLNPGETAHLERQEAGINREERGMRARDNGHLARYDRRTINHQQNRESHRIYRDKHNGR